MLPPVDDDEDLLLEEENPEIYMHLENVLVHMINAQDIAIFKSQKNYVRNKQKLSEYRLPEPILDHFWEFSNFTLFCQKILVRIQ